MTRVLPHLTGLKYICILTSLLFLSFFVSNCFAESASTSEWNISADKITRFDSPESIIAEGNIVLKKREKLPPKPIKVDTTVTSWTVLLEEEGTATEVSPEDLQKDKKPRIVTTITIKADWLAYDIEKQSIKARGNVSIESVDDKLYADQAQIDLTTETGSFTDAKIIRKDHDLHLEGNKIEKTGLKTYYVEGGWLITCKVEEGETPPWSIASSETTIEEDGYAVLKHARFNIKDVPVFYTPYLIVPSKNTRQTGFLIPDISTSSRDGIGFNLPLFLNISDSADLTFFSEYYSKRGFMPSAEFRYVLSEANKATLMGTFLDDKLSDPSETGYYSDTGFTHTNSDRYWLRGKADHDFGANWITRLDFDVVSDVDYLSEFRSGDAGFNSSHSNALKTFGRGFQHMDDDQRKNSLKILRTWSASSLNINLLAVNDVRVSETAPTPLWQLPSIDYTGALAIGESSFTFDWDTDYVNYWREDGVGGHRIDLNPRLSAPLPLGSYFESRAEIGLRETLYSVTTNGDAEWTTDDSPNRFLYTFHTDVATTLLRDYRLENDEYSMVSHSIRPYILYDYISEDDQTDLPDFDSVDLIEDTNAITYGVDTYFDLYETDDKGADDHARQYGYFKIYQSYDLRSDYSDEPFSPVTVKLGWYPLKKLGIVYKADIPIEDDDYTTHGLETAFTNSRGDYFLLDYRYNEEDDIEQLNAHFKALLTAKILADFKIEHSIFEDETNKASLALTYQALCWSVMLKGSYTPTDERITLVFNLANISSPLDVDF